MTRVIARNTLFNLAGQAIPLMVGAITIPFTIRWLGPARFGVLALVWVLIGYVTVLDLGFGRATTRFVAAAIGRDEREIPSLAGAALAAHALLGALGAVLLWSGAALLANALRLPAGIADEATGAFRVLAVCAPVVLISTSARGILEAAQRFDLVNAARLPMGAMNFLLPLVGAAAHWPLPRIVASILGMQVAGLLAQCMLCIRVLPGLRRPRFEYRTFKRLLRFGGWVAVSALVGPVLVYVDRFIIAAMVGIAAVGYYTAPYEVVTRLSIISVSLVVALFPVFSRGHQSPAMLDTLASRSLRTLLLTMGAVVIATILLAEDIVRLWLGSEFASIVTTPFQILAVGVLMNSLASVPYALLQAIGRPDITAKIHLIELPIHLILVWALVSRFGLVGAALAWSIRVTVDAALLFVAAARHGPLTFRSLRASIAPTFLPLLSFLAVAGVAASVLHSLPLRVAALASVLGATAVLHPQVRDVWPRTASSSRP